MRSREEIERIYRSDSMPVGIDMEGRAIYNEKPLSLELELLLDIRDAVTSDPHSASVEGVFLDDRRLNTVTRMAFIHLNDLRTKAKAVVDLMEGAKMWRPEMEALLDELRRQGVIK